jgi:4-hydroxybenzoate polyprenyltransferase
MHDTVIAHASLVRFRGLLALLRPRQWVKNLFVLAPLLFAGEFANPHAITQVLVAAVIFCLASSAVYIVNDIHDIRHDQLHPKKRFTRPLASGAVPLSSALLMLLMLYGVIFSNLFQMPQVSLVVAAYIVLNLAYTFVLKQQPVLDLFTIAIGFVLRVFAGAVALHVPVSAWMFITTLCLALYLASVKRRQELRQSGSAGRSVLQRYSVVLVDRYAQMAATGALLFYSMFVMTARPRMVITIPLVLFGLFRYWFVVEAQEGGESPTDVLLTDWQLIGAITLWVGACAWALWPVLGAS